uniref:Rho termination factor N-terminal domain-containing protein n=1 Tax=Davidia involucrata TaxID=16924 RepID=A0A5B7B8Q9_DAVIN
MEWALWDTSYEQVGQESSNVMGQGWQSDFYSGYGLDVIEEGALNEKFCMQVLEVLITKADTEIVELEEDLIILQSQLALADEEWSTICSAALREKIDCLGISIQSLKNENVQDQQDIGDCLPMHKKPAERMHEIVKTLLGNYFQPKDEQPVDVTVKELSSDGVGHATDHLGENKILSNSASDSVRNEKAKEPSNTPQERHAISNSSLKPLGKKTNYPGTVKPANTVIHNSSLNAEKLASGYSNAERNLSNCSSKFNSEEVTEKSSTPTASILDLPLKPEKKRTDVAEKDETKAALSSLLHQRTDVGEKDKCKDTIIKDSSSNALGHATDNPSEKKELSKFNLKVNRKEGDKKHKPTPEDTSKISNSSLKSAWKRTNFPKTARPGSAIVKDSNSDASGHATGSKGNNNLSKTDSKVNREMEVNEQSSTDKSIIIKSSLEPGGKGTTLSDTIESADTILDSRSNKATEDSKVKPKLSQRPEVPQADKIDSSNSSLKTKKKRVKAPKRVKGPEASLTDNEHAAADSLLELLKHGREHTTNPQPKKVQKPQPKQVQNVELASTEDESNPNLSLKPQRHRRKRKLQSNAVCVQEPGFSPVEIGSDSSSITKTKRQRKSRMADNNANSNQSANRGTKEEKAESDLCWSEHCVTPDVSINSVSQSQKKRKMSSNSPVLEKTKELRGLQISLAKLHDKTTDSTNEEDLWITECSFTNDSDNEPLKYLCCPTLPYPTQKQVEYLSVVDLRSIAKQHKLRGYHKLRKAELAEQLGLRVQVRGEKKEKRKKPSPPLPV